MTVDKEFRKIKDIISLTSELAYAGNWDELSKLLDELDLSLPTVLLVAWARSTCPMRTKLPNWQDTIYKIRDEFDIRNEPKSLLKGLL